LDLIYKQPMILKLFKSNHPVVIFLIPLLGIILWIPTLFGLNTATGSLPIYQTTLLYQWCFGFLVTMPKLANWIALLFLVVQSFILIRLNFKFIFIESKTYLPAVMFVLFGSILLPYQQLHPALVSNFFLLAAIDRSFVFDKERNQIKRYYESGFLLGLGALFFPNLYLLLVLVGFALVILHNSTWREWLGTLIGFATPVIFYFAFLFLSDLYQKGYSNMMLLVRLPTPKLSITYWMFIPMGLLTVTLAISLLWSLQFVGIKKISSRKYFTLFLWFFILVVGTILFHPFVGFELIYLAAIPLAVLYSIFFAESRSIWFVELMFTFTLGSILAAIWLF